MKEEEEEEVEEGRKEGRKEVKSGSSRPNGGMKTLRESVFVLTLSSFQVVLEEKIM